MILKQKQQGATTGVVLTGITLALLMAWTALKLGPVYLQHYSIVKILNKVQTEYARKLDDDSLISTKEIKVTLMKHFDINYISHVNKRDIIIERTPKGFNVGIQYEVVVPFMGNIDALIRFENEVDIRPNNDKLASLSETSPTTPPSS